VCVGGGGGGAEHGDSVKGERALTRPPETPPTALARSSMVATCTPLTWSALQPRGVTRKHGNEESRESRDALQTQEEGAK
jgi:hypothetical protein